MIIVFRTEPFLTKSRRFQLRCVLEMPIQVQKGQDITGELRLKSHSRQSYDVHLQLTGQLSAPLQACPLAELPPWRATAASIALVHLAFFQNVAKCPGVSELSVRCPQARRSPPATRRRRCAVLVVKYACNVHCACSTSCADAMPQKPSDLLDLHNHAAKGWTTHEIRLADSCIIPRMCRRRVCWI